MRQVVTRFGITAMLGLAAAGCAGRHNERIAMLEQANRNLTDRLNGMRGQLDDAHRTRMQCEQQLANSRGRIDELNRQLAEVPQQPEAAPGWTATPTGAMIAIQTNVLFAPGKTALIPEARRTLDGIVSTLQGEYSGYDVLVFGHTDDQPIKKSGWEDNWELSAERALAVVRYLRDRGLSPSMLTACGGGEFRPKVPNDSQLHRAQNRRVEIFAVDPALELGRS